MEPGAAELGVLLVAIRVGLGLVRRDALTMDPPSLTRRAYRAVSEAAEVESHAQSRKGVTRVSILWIILIVVLVLLLLGFFSRGRW